MRNIVLCLLVLIAVPATAQRGLFGRGPHSSSRVVAGQPQSGPLMAPGRTLHIERHGMNPSDFEAAVNMISNENFDEKRLALAKRIVTDNLMSSRQIAHVCSLFSFEANRLDFAKYAYLYCVDPNRYFLLDGVFNFEASKKDLYDYIQQLKQQ